MTFAITFHESPYKSPYKYLREMQTEELIPRKCDFLIKSFLVYGYELLKFVGGYLKKTLLLVTEH